MGLRNVKVPMGFRLFQLLQFQKSSFIIIIKRDRQCKAEREGYTPYQSVDPSPQYQPIDRKKRKEKIEEDLSRDRAA